MMGFESAKKSFVFFWASYSCKVNYKFSSDFGFHLILQLSIELVLWPLEEMVCHPSQLQEMEESLVSHTGSITDVGGTYSLSRAVCREALPSFTKQENKRKPFTDSAERRRGRGRRDCWRPRVKTDGWDENQGGALEFCKYPESFR